MTRWTRLVSCVAALSLAGAACGAPARANSATAKPATTEANITRVTSSILAHSQFSHHPLDSQLASKFLDGYLDELDGNRTLFLQSDVNELAKYRTTLARSTGDLGDTSAARAIFSRYLERLAQRATYVAELLERDRFDFSGAGSYQPDRSHDARPADLPSARRLWTEQLRAEYLDEKLADDKAGPIETVLARRYASQLQTMKALHPDEVLEIYLNALAHVYDPHSDYLGHEQMENLAIAMNLSLFGIGATLGSTDGHCKVIDLVPGGPAARDGKLKPDDRIVAVAQQGQAPVDINDMPLSRVVGLIRGPKGSSVTLTVMPGGIAGSATPERVSIVRDKVELEDAQASARIVDIPGDKHAFRLGVLEVPAFYADMGEHAGGVRSVTRDVARLLTKLKAEHVQGVVLDLRSNGGGSLSEAISLTGLFIAQGPVVQTRGSTGDVEVEADTDPSQLYAGPLVVLTSRLSASASEILSGALQDYGRALIVGDSSTFGKGTVQSIVRLARIMDANKLGHAYDPGALKVTTHKFYRPDGASTQLRGVVSDIVIPSETDLDRLSESAMKDPLPWDALPAAPHEHLGWVAPYVATLRDESARRIVSDEAFTYLRKDATALRARLARKSVSLNEAERRQELAVAKAAQQKLAETSAEARPSQRIYDITLKNVAAIGLPAPEPAAALGGAEAAQQTAGTKHRPAPPDLVLGETEHIMRDYVDLLDAAHPRQHQADLR